MTDDQNKVLKALHDLVASCNDAAEGYGKAAKGVHDRDLSDWLANIANERLRFAEDLSAAIKKAGGQARIDLHGGGILHSGWVDLEQRIRPKQEREILDQCIAGDTSTLKHYAHAIGLDIPEHIRSVVEQQRNAVQRDLDSLQKRAVRHKSQHA